MNCMRVRGIEGLWVEVFVVIDAIVDMHAHMIWLSESW